jgi:predicted Zn-dependent peptidase
MRRCGRPHRPLVVGGQEAADAGAFTFDLTKGSDLLIVDVTARPEIAPEQLEREVAAEIDRMRADGVTPAEVERAVALIETDLVASLQSAGSRADKLSLFTTYFGDPMLVNGEVDRYRLVTDDEVSAFAAERLGEDNRASLLYVPKSDASGDVGNREAEAVSAGGTA